MSGHDADLGDLPLEQYLAWLATATEEELLEEEIRALLRRPDEPSASVVQGFRPAYGRALDDARGCSGHVPTALLPLPESVIDRCGGLDRVDDVMVVSLVGDVHAPAAIRLAWFVYEPAADLPTVAVVTSDHRVWPLIAAVPQATELSVVVPIARAAQAEPGPSGRQEPLAIVIVDDVHTEEGEDAGRCKSGPRPTDGTPTTTDRDVADGEPDRAQRNETMESPENPSTEKSARDGKRNSFRRIRRWTAAAAVGIAAMAAVVPGASPAHADDGVIAEWSGTTLLGRAQNGWHGWGSCRVVDFNGGAWGWYIRAASNVYAPTYRVHHGMLSGWTAQGGAAGWLRCPTNNEYGYYGGARQDFQGGSVLWWNGAPAQATSQRAAAIVNNALRFNGQWGGNACIAAGLGSGGSVAGFSGGQCRQFVNCVVYGAIGLNPGGSTGLTNTGAVRVSGTASLRPGDIIQTSAPHTAIVLINYGNGRVKVVDSNWNLNEIVTIHDWTVPAGAELWRYN